MFFTLASAVGLFLIIRNLDPYASSFNLIFLYADIFILSFGIAELTGFFTRRIFGVRELAHKHLVVSLRQAVWLGLLVMLSLVLLGFGLFNWWNAILLVFCLIFLESYFLFK